MTSAARATGASAWNVPNLLTTVRLALAIAVIFTIALALWRVSLVLFVLAASTDWMDGYWARRYGQITKLGRIFDPFVDKVIICGAFIALVAVPLAGIAAWMAVVVVARELLVTSLRGLIEGAGGDFSARQLGKWKMVLQCAAVILALVALGWRQSGGALILVRDITIWAAILLTLYSGLDYLFAAARAMRGEDQAQ